MRLDGHVYRPQHILIRQLYATQGPPRQSVLAVGVWGGYGVTRASDTPFPYMIAEAEVSAISRLATWIVGQPWVSPCIGSCPDLPHFVDGGRHDIDPLVAHCSNSEYRCVHVRTGVP